MPLFWPGVSTTVEALLLKAEIRGQLNKIFTRVIYKCRTIVTFVNYTCKSSIKMTLGSVFVSLSTTT